MKYYKVKPENDQKRRRDGSILIANELYTEKELNHYKIAAARCDEIEIPKSAIYWCFGARFAK